MEFSSGNIYKHRDRWVGQILCTDDSGKRKRLTHTLANPDGTPIACDAKTNRGRNAALGALKRWRDELVAAAGEEDGQGAPATLDGVTVSQFLTDYLDGLEASHHTERSTLVGYRASARKVSETLGAVEVAKLTTKQIQAWENSMLNDEGLSSRSVIKHHCLLSQALKSAVEEGRLEANPCAGVKLPKVVRHQPHALTKATANELLGTLASMEQGRTVSAARIALLSGLRVGEVCGLQWKDIDRQAGTLHVNKAVGVGDGGSYIKSTKNVYSVRDIPMTPQLMDALDARRRQVLHDAEELGVLPSPDQLAELYVVGSINGRPASPNCISREWGQLRRMLNVRNADGTATKFHDLRHSWATFAVQSGADIKSVSAIMGHADASMTLNTYSSSDADARRLAAQKISVFMGDAPHHGDVLGMPKANGTEGR